MLQVLSELMGGVSNATQVATQCMSLPATWRDTPADMDTELYCSWRKADCPPAAAGHPPGVIRSAAYDFKLKQSTRLFASQGRDRIGFLNVLCGTYAKHAEFEGCCNSCV